MINLKKHKLFLTILITVVLSLFTLGLENKPIEELGIQTGTGVDIEKNSSGIASYVVSRNFFIFRPNNATISTVLTGKGSTITNSRQDRQLKSNTREIFGQERIYVLGEEEAIYGVKDTVDAMFRNQLVNDISWFLVCKDKAKEILEFKIPGYISSADYIDEMIKNSNEYNFFSDKYSLLDIYKILMGEGQNIVVPYIEIKEGDIQVTGVAAFKGNKMKYKIDIPDAKVLNLLRYSNVNGSFSIQKDSKHYIDYYAKSKRKVKCTKEGEKFRFDIYINLKGDIVSNQLYENILKDPKAKKEFEKEISKKVEEMSNEFISKMKIDYQIDLLDLGKTAASKFGRRTGTDWNKSVTDSIIKVHVNAKVDKQGRGDY